MRLKEPVLWLASVAIAGLLGPATAGISAQASQPAPKTGATAAETECHGNSCTVPLDDAAPNSGTSAATKPYDWKASFAAYKVGKVPRTADGKPDLQGIWSRSILTPIERPGNEV